MIAQDTQAADSYRLAAVEPAARSATGSPEPELHEEDLSGSSLGDFDLLGPVDRGQMAVVYAARQRPLGRIVALKVLRAHRETDERSVRCFRREAAAAARLDHPGISRIHAAGLADGRHYIAMEYIDGCSLEDRIAALSQEAHTPWVRQNLSMDRCRAAIHVVGAIGDALQHAHERGVAHCDINPRNVVVDQRNQPRLIDFGLARIDGDNAEFAGSVAGTLLYMSPEQLLAGCVEIDHRTDIFSLGVLLYELLTLHRPFQGASGQDLAFDLVFRDPLPAKRLNPSVSSAMQRVCHRAIAKNPEARFSDMASFVDALRACSQGGGS